MQVETTAVTYAQTRSGVRVVMSTGDYVKTTREGKSRVMRLVGTLGQIEFWGWENGYYIQNAAFPQGQVILPGEFSVYGHQRHLETLADMVAGPIDCRVAESSLTALEICEGAYLSSRHRCKVTFPVDRFAPPEESDWQPGRPYGGHGGGRDGKTV
jgi:hypothetical protein